MLSNPIKSVVVLLLAFGLLATRAGAEEESPRLDAQGDPLPNEAVSRLGTTRLRDGGYVEGLVFSPDGKTLISDGDDGISIWDVVTGKQLRHFKSDWGRGPRERFSLSPDGAEIAIPFDGAIHLFEVNTDKEVRSFGSKGGSYYTLRFSPNGKKLAALCGVADKSGLVESRPRVLYRLEIWDAATGRKVSSQNIGKGRSSLLGWADEKTPILVNYFGDELRLWDADAGEFRQQFLVGELTSEGGRMAASPAGGLLAVICDDRRTRCLRIWNVATGKQTQQLGAYVIMTEQWSGVPSKYLTVVAFAQDGKTLVTNSQDGTLIFWDTATGAEVRRFARGLPGAQALALSPDGKTLAGACGHTIRLLDLTTGKERLPQEGLQDSVNATAVSADGRTAVTACRNRIVLWDAATGKELGCPDGSPDLVEAIQTGADGRSLVSLGCGNTQATWDVQTLQAWELPTGKQLRRVERKVEGASRLRLLALAPDGKTAAVQLELNTKRACLLDLATGKVQRGFDLEGDTTQIYGAAFSSDGGSLIVWSSGDNLVRVWDVSTGRRLHQFVMMDKYGSEDHVGGGYVAAVSPDGRCILFTSQNFFILYDVAAGREFVRLDKPADYPADGRLIAFSPDGRMFAWKGRGPRTVYLTETASLRERCQFVAPQGEVTALTFSADGRTLITGNSDTTALVWDLTGRLREKGAWGKPLAVADLDACWSDLAGEDAAQAYRAVQRLAGSAKDAVAYLKPRLRPIPALDEKRVVRLIADLDGDDFDGREKATKELGKWEEAGLNSYQKALENAPAPEARRRLEILVADQERRRRYPPAQRLQSLRALEVLERADTPEARRVLETLAAGALGASLTDEAKASLERSLKGAERDKQDPLP